MGDFKIAKLPNGYVRKVIAWLPLRDAYYASVTCQRWRGCGMVTVVAKLSSASARTRVRASLAFTSLATDLASWLAAVVADAHIGLIKMLQDAEEDSNDVMRNAAVKCILTLHERYRGYKAEHPQNALHNSAEADILIKLPVLAGLTNPDGSSDDEESGTDDDSGNEEEEKAEPVPSIHDQMSTVSISDFGGKEDSPAEIDLPPVARMKVLFHEPAQFVPVTALGTIQGNAAVTVIQRYDNKQKLLTIGSWYLEGFLESEVDADKKLGETIILWYARTLIGALAVSGVMHQTPGLSANVCILGLGAGSIPAFLRHHYDHITVDAVDWSASVVKCARDVFGLDASKDKMLNVYTAEACNWVQERKDRLQWIDNPAEREREKYDVICVDIYTDNGMPPALKDVQFFKNMKAILKSNKCRLEGDDKESVLVFNAGNEMENFDGLLRNLGRVFKFVHSFEHPDEENVIIMCTDTDLMDDDGKRWREACARDIPESAFRIYLSKCTPEYDSTFVSWMDDKSCCARDSRGINTPALTAPLSPSKNDAMMMKK